MNFCQISECMSKIQQKLPTAAFLCQAVHNKMCIQPLTKELQDLRRLGRSSRLQMFFRVFVFPGPLLEFVFTGPGP